eukprot:m.52810 g.52810  ORF g.52810 m.52810 type:complete len:271 (+) comp34235_c0_seq1:1073-1885(+)
MNSKLLPAFPICLPTGVPHLTTTCLNQSIYLIIKCFVFSFSIQRSPPPAAPPVSAPSTLSPCSCCGGPVHYTLPVRPTPFSLASAHRLPYPGTTFPVNLPSLHYAGVPGLVPPSSIPRFKTSDGSAFSPILQTKVPPLLYPTPIPAFPYLERTSIACPLPVHPHTHAAAPPAAFPSFRHPSGSSRTEEKSKSAGDVRKGKSSSTDVDIDEHFKRSLQGDRLRQFYPYPTDDKGSVDNHFKRALGEEWNKVKSVETGGQDKNGSRVSIKTL